MGRFPPGHPMWHTNYQYPSDEAATRDGNPCTDGRAPFSGRTLTQHYDREQPAMNQIDDRQRKINSRIERLRQRVKDAPLDANIRAFMLGVLDLLADEL